MKKLLLITVFLLASTILSYASLCGEHYACKEETLSCGIEYMARLNNADFTKLIDQSKNKNYDIEYLNVTDSYTKFIYRENCVYKNVCIDQTGVCE